MYSNYDVFRYKALTASKFFWVVGHGTTLPGFTRVPPNRWVVFLSKPGHVLLSEPFASPIFQNIIKDTQVTRSLALGNIPKENLPGIRLHESSWKNYVYGPGDDLPNTFITFQPKQPINNIGGILGVHDTSKPNEPPVLQGRAQDNVNRIISRKQGIYFFVTCRPSQGQLQNRNKLRIATTFNRRRGGGQNSPITYVPDPSGVINNIKRRNINRIQAQFVCRWNQSGYHRQCGIVLNPSLEGPRPTKKRILNPPGNGPAPIANSQPPFANGLFTFAPGVPMSRAPRPRYYPPRKPRPRKPVKK